MRILRKCRHRNVVQLVSLWETSSKIYLVLELVEGGELFDHIVDAGSYSEADASCLTGQIVSAVSYLHSKGVVHRDLKPENLLYAGNKPDGSVGDIKLADFGLSKLFQQDNSLQTACGTPGYVAPEVLSGKGYGKEVDLWSVGVIMYILLCGFPPFYDDNTAALFKQIMAGSFSFPSPYWDNVSSEAKDLINKLLVVDPKKRLTAKEVLSHPWIMKPRKDHQLSMVADSMKSFNAKRRWKGAVHTLIATNRFKAAIRGLKAGAMEPIDDPEFAQAKETVPEFDDEEEAAGEKLEGSGAEPIAATTTDTGPSTSSA